MKLKKKKYHQSRVCIGIMVGQVADILTVLEGDGKGQGVKGSSPSALCWTKVVSVGEN